jgi:hypothetical protein
VFTLQFFDETCAAAIKDRMHTTQKIREIVLFRNSFYFKEYRPEAIRTARYKSFKSTLMNQMDECPYISPGPMAKILGS